MEFEFPVYNNLKEELDELNIQLAIVKNRIAIITEQMGELRTNGHAPKKKLFIMDHALVRYCERKHQLPIKAIREEIRDLLDEAKNPNELRTLGFVVNKNHVITYMPPHWDRWKD